MDLISVDFIFFILDGYSKLPSSSSLKSQFEYGFFCLLKTVLDIFISVSILSVPYKNTFFCSTNGFDFVPLTRSKNELSCKPF